MSVEVIGGSGGSQIVVSQSAEGKVSQSDKKNEVAKVELSKEPVKHPTPAEEEKALKEAAEKINEFIESMTTDLQFSFDKDAGRMVVRVMSRKDGEVVRQIPSKEALEIAKALDTLKGLIIRKKA
ncbi:flagellar protein FlaG [Geobacter sp.]|uniref:flagellar protein FlaG n=1 Tax=Geobacter sp. TaxID=46610 RepID=UPI002630F965|nr:flagellar protein FlaG [Geobacter sp.]